jgi:RNA polymerase sigma-70 factor (sigma-E family)
VRVRRDDEFTAYVAARARPLRRSAYLLCGDWHRAEDLTQSALTKAYLAWSRVRRADNVDGYVRQVLVRTYLDEQRRRWRSEQPTGETLDGLRPDPAAASDQRLDLLRALAMLPPRQRAAVVLRCWEDLPITEVARALDCSEGTVKSQTSRGLAALRGVLAPGRYDGFPEGASR